MDKRLAVFLGLFFAFFAQQATADRAVTGTVADADNTPVAGAHIAFIYAADAEQTFDAMTASDGGYEVLLSPILTDSPTAVGEIQESGIPKTAQLFHNYPNPFNPNTVIPYNLAEPGYVELSIYNALGHKIRTLVDRYQEAGAYSVEWDGHNALGGGVSGGVYFYRLKAGGYERASKMAMVDGSSTKGVVLSGSRLHKPVALAQEEQDRYTVRITGEDIENFRATNVAIPEDNKLDFTVSRLPDDSPFSTGGDITNALASSRSGDCTTYVNTYASSVTNVIDGNSYAGEVAISVSGDKCIFASNAIPNHDMGEGDDARFAHTIVAQDVTYEIPKAPTLAANPTYNIWKASVVILNGGKVDILPAACYDVGDDDLGREKIGCGPDQLDHPWRYDAMSPLNNFGTDIHHAHVQPDGMYHYHANPMAVFENDCTAVSSSSPVIGFAADGFPVFGSCINDNGSIRSAQSSYQLKDGGSPRQDVAGYTTPAAGTGGISSSSYDGQFRGDYEYVDGSGDLDECNGMSVDGQYGYYITPSYPWVLSCYSGTPDSSFNPTPTGPPPGDGPPPG